MGDWVKPAEEEVEKEIWALFEAYVGTLELRSKFQLPVFMGDDGLKELNITAGFVESTAFSFVHRTTMKVLQRPNFPANMQVQLPPGAQVPLVPWATRAYDFSLQSVQWQENTDAV
jgi:hypothetical protein